jgi:hypothetical protein
MSHSQAINLFLQSADTLYGPITTICRNGRIEKKIPWSAFTLTEKDWDRVADARDILKDSNDIQEFFSSEQQPTLWRVLPVLEELQTAWEDKQKSPRFFLYRDAIDAGLAKLQKYYSRINTKPVFILALGKFVCFLSASRYNINLQFSTHTTNLITSSYLGVVLRNRDWSTMVEIPLPKTGKTRCSRLSRGQ